MTNQQRTVTEFLFRCQLEYLNSRQTRLKLGDFQTRTKPLFLTHFTLVINARGLSEELSAVGFVALMLPYLTKKHLDKIYCLHLENIAAMMALAAELFLSRSALTQHYVSCPPTLPISNTKLFYVTFFRCAFLLIVYAADIKLLRNGDLFRSRYKSYTDI